MIKTREHFDPIRLDLDQTDMNPGTVAGMRRVIACDAHTLMQSREEAEMGDFFFGDGPPVSNAGGGPNHLCGVDGGEPSVTLCHRHL